ncbi:MAG: homoserine kinase [Bacteroidota bacterium]
MNQLDEVRVFAPATVANVAVGFDILGFAFHGPGDEVVLRRSKQAGLRITAITGTGDKQLPLISEKNTAGFAALELFKHLGIEGGFEMEIHKKMPFGSGLGSSAASAAAGVFAANTLLGSPLKKEELLPFAVAGEQIADGAYHADNVGPSLLGGILFIRDNQTLDVHSLPVPDDLHVAVVYPHVEILTKDARAVLSDQVCLKQHIQQNGNLGAFLVALYEKDYDLIQRSLQDLIIEPQRAQLIPGFHDVKTSALNAGALGASISGAGPSVFALCQSEATAQTVAQKMSEAFTTHGITNNSYASPINMMGAIQI